jgi:hypothetical protein
MGFCANCGQPRNGSVRFCGSCGTEFDDSPAAPDEQATKASGWTAPADATRTDMSPGDTRIDPPGAKGEPPGQPDPFASWYSSAQPAAAPEPPHGSPGTYWQQPTETVRPTPPGPGGYAPPPAGPGGYPTAAYNAPYPPGPPAGPPQRGGGGGRRGLLVVLAIIVVLAAGGGAYAIATHLGKHSTAGATTPPASTSAASSPSGATQTATGTRSGSASASASASASKSSPSQSPSQGLVAIGPGVSGAAVPQVQQLLSERFQAINTHNYAEYASTLTTRAQASQTQANFDKGYRSTSDSGIELTALNQTSSGLTATVAFTSHQDPSDSVDGSACNTWTSTYNLVPSGSGYLIDTGSPAPAHGDC